MSCRRPLLALLLCGLWLTAGPGRAGEAPPAAEAAKVSEYVEALRDKDPAVRKQVAVALGEMGARARAAVPALRQALLDPNAGVRAAAAAALENIGGGPRRPAREDTELARRLREEAERVRRLREEVGATRRAAEDQAARSEAARDAVAKYMRAMDAQIADLQKQLAAERDRATAAQVQAARLLQRNEELLKKVERLTRERARVGGTPAVPGAATNPPRADLEGVVKKADTASGLVTISIGSDAGLEKGHTLEVYRLDPPKYLGAVRVVDVTAREAVARPVGRLREPIKVGDRVASRFPAK